MVFTLAGMALYIHLMVYTGLSLFIIRRANVYLVVCVLTRITLQQLTRYETVNPRSEHYSHRVKGSMPVRGNFFAEFILL